MCYTNTWHEYNTPVLIRTSFPLIWRNFLFLFFLFFFSIARTDRALCLCAGCACVWRCRQSYAGRKRSAAIGKLFSGPLEPSHPPLSILSARGYTSRDYARKNVILCKHHGQFGCSRLCVALYTTARPGNKKGVRPELLLCRQGFFRRLLDGTVEHRLRCVR